MPSTIINAQLVLRWRHRGLTKAGLSQAANKTSKLPTNKI
jgi:hypothetical protein